MPHEHETTIPVVKYKPRYPGEKRKRDKRRSPEVGAGHMLPKLTKGQTETIEKSQMSRGEIPMSIQRTVDRQMKKLKATQTLAGGGQIEKKFRELVDYMSSHKGQLPGSGSDIADEYRATYGTKSDLWQRYRDIQAASQKKPKVRKTYKFDEDE